MSRKAETIDRAAWAAMLEHLDGDDQVSLRAELEQWQGGETCEAIKVSLDSLGRVDSVSSPRPA